MLKTACVLTGENYKLLSADTPASKKKVVALSLAILIPVSIWVFNGFMLLYQVLKAGWGWALITAAVCGSIVFLIEKLIIMANGNGWLTFFRICIGFVVALLGSIALDEVVFKDDIDISVVQVKGDFIKKAKKKAETEFIELSNMADLNTKISTAQQNFDKIEAAVLAEGDGSMGTKNKGIGSVTLFKDKKAQERKEDLFNLQNTQTALSLRKDSVVNEAGKNAAKSFKDHALLTRLKALFNLVASDGYMMTVYILFTILMFLFEFLVVILKHTWKKTNYERRLEMIEEIGIRRMEFLMKKDSPVLDPGYYLPQLEMARNAVRKIDSLYN